MKRALVAILLWTQASGAIPTSFIPEKPIEEPNEGRAFASLLLPGLSQWRHGQSEYAMAYTGSALAGGIYGLSRIFSTQPGSDDFRGADRLGTMGVQLYTTMGAISTYHGFRTEVFSAKDRLGYDFLPTDETPLDLFLSPFRFDYLIRPTTLLPLAAVAVLFTTVLPNAYNERVVWGNLSAGDVAFLGGVSYMAGTGEEAVFRGALLPYLHKTWNNPLLANLATAGLFALAHISPNRSEFFIPWPQLLGGLYFGWVTQHRGYHIGEAIFIHAWYDVIVFATYLASEKTAYLPLPTISLQF